LRYNVGTGSPAAILEIRMLKYFCLLIAALMPLLATAADPAEGRWKTIDDETGQAKSIVEITQGDNGALSGRIVELLNPSRPNPTCDKCKDDRKGKPITGMEIIRGMKRDGDAYAGGTILKPDEGKVYKSKMELLDGGGRLEVSGCVAFICKSQVWVRQ
jgi:uncharacterized protein (DUF2147 family)